MSSRSTGLRILAGACVLVLFDLLSGCGSGSSSSDWFYHWNCNGDPECLATNPAGTPSGTSDEGPNESSCTQLLQFAQQFWGMPPATDSCDQNSNGSSGGSGGTTVTVSGFTPASTAPGNNITISGSGFSTSGSTVTVNGVTCAIVTVSSTQIVCTLGAMGNFTGSVVVNGVSSTSSLVVFNHFFGVGASSAQAIAVGGNTTLSGSVDGTTWRTVNLSSSAYLSAIAVSGGPSIFTYVTVGQSGSIYVNQTGGFSWTPQTTGTSANLFGVASSGSLFVAVGASGTIITSPTGATWTARASNTSQNLAGVAWCASQFVAVGNNGVIDTSPDGVNWTLRTSGTTDFLNGVGCSGSMIVVGAGNQSTGGEIFSSPDGITWNPRALPSANAVYGVAYSGTTFVAAGFGGTIYTSSDGINWTSRISGSTQSLNAATWFAAHSQFVLVGGFGTILTSADGMNWTPHTPQ